MILIETIRDQLVLEEADNKAELQEIAEKIGKVRPKCSRQFNELSKLALTKLVKFESSRSLHRNYDSSLIQNESVNS